MKIKIDGQLKDAEGNPIINGTKPAVTLRDVCISSILTPTEGDDEIKKFAKYEIFKKLRDAKIEVTLTVEEIAMIKKGIGRFQPPLILGQCFEMLEKQ